jgi:uracil-DNA glycosylase
MQQWGEIQYATEVPGEGGQIQGLPFTGNFSTADFTYWPDRKTYEALEFEPPGFFQGKILRWGDE